MTVVMVVMVSGRCGGMASVEEAGAHIYIYTHVYLELLGAHDVEQTRCRESGLAWL